MIKPGAALVITRYIVVTEKKKKGGIFFKKKKKGKVQFIKFHGTFTKNQEK